MIQGDPVKFWLIAAAVFALIALGITFPPPRLSAANAPATAAQQKAWLGACATGGWNHTTGSWVFGANTLYVGIKCPSGQQTVALSTNLAVLYVEGYFQTGSLAPLLWSKTPATLTTCQQQSPWVAQPVFCTVGGNAYEGGSSTSATGANATVIGTEGAGLPCYPAGITLALPAGSPSGSAWCIGPSNEWAAGTPLP